MQMQISNTLKALKSTKNLKQETFCKLKLKSKPIFASLLLGLVTRLSFVCKEKERKKEIGAKITQLKLNSILCACLEFALVFLRFF